MTRCSFLRGRSILTCFVLYITSAWGKEEPTDRSVGNVLAAVAAVQRNAHRDLTGKHSGLTIHTFQHLSIQSRAQPISSMSGLDDIQAFLRNKEGRRAQDACSTEKETLYTCLPDGQCEGCYTGLLQAIENDVDGGTITLCGEIESRLCAVNTTCACGCESQAEVYYQCLVDEQLCETTVDCADTACEEEIIKLADCQSVVGNSCIDCVRADVDLLFGTASTASCPDLESTICASSDTCGCGDCTDEVIGLYTCVFMEDCTNFACGAPIAPSPVSSPVAAPVEVLAPGAPTPAPTLGVVCYVCGDEDMKVTEGLIITVDDDELPCTDLEEVGLRRAFSESECGIAQVLAARDCDCVSNQPPTESPVAPPVASTPPPSYSDTCFVCGDSDLSVDPTKSVAIGNEDRPCSDVQDEFESSRQVSSFECNILIEAVTESCNCRAARAIPSPPTTSPMAETTTESEGFNYAALSALVAIPLLGVIVYLVSCKKTDDASGTKPVPISAGAPEKEFGETPPATPSPNRHYSHIPNSYHHPTDSSATASMRTDEDYIYGRPPVAMVTPAVQSSGGGWAASGSASGTASGTVRSHEDHLHDSVGEVSAGSGRSSDPSGAFANVDSRHYSSSPAATLRSSGEGGYMPHNKDQCRSVAEDVPMAVVVDEVDTTRQDAYERKRHADP